MTSIMTYIIVLLLFFRYVKRRRAHRGRENLYESKFNPLHFICIYCKIKKYKNKNKLQFEFSLKNKKKLKTPYYKVKNISII